MSEKRIKLDTACIRRLGIHADMFKNISRIAKSSKTQLYVVGGIIRDSLIGRHNQKFDIDFIIQNDAFKFGKKVSCALKGAFVALDPDHGSCRVVVKNNTLDYTLDFTDMRAKTLEGDLLLRDFTINSIAVCLDTLIESFSAKKESVYCIDPNAGLVDLKRRKIRMCSKHSFPDDPVRIVRAFSFSALLGFSIDEATGKNLISLKTKLNNAAGERIRDEMFKILDTRNSFSTIQAMNKAGVFDILFPEFKPLKGIGKGAYHHLDVRDHSFETLNQLENIIRQGIPDAAQLHLASLFDCGRSKMALLKLAALIHDVGKPATMRKKEDKLTFYGHERLGANMAELIAKRFKLSNEELKSLKTMVLWHLRPGYLADMNTPTARAKFRFFRDTGSLAISVLLLSLADQRATKGPLSTRSSRMQHERVVKSLLAEHIQSLTVEKPKRLVSGDDLLNDFSLKPSPLIGRLLDEISESQGIGKISTKEEAYALVRKRIAKNLKKRS